MSSSILMVQMPNRWTDRTIMRPLGTLMSELSGEDDPDCERRCFKMFCPGYLWISRDISGYHEISNKRISLGNKTRISQDIFGYLWQINERLSQDISGNLFSGVTRVLEEESQISVERRLLSSWAENNNQAHLLS